MQARPAVFVCGGTRIAPGQRCWVTWRGVFEACKRWHVFGTFGGGGQRCVAPMSGVPSSSRSCAGCQQAACMCEVLWRASGVAAAAPSMLRREHWLHGALRARLQAGQKGALSLRAKRDCCSVTGRRRACTNRPGAARMRDWRCVCFFQSGLRIVRAARHHQACNACVSGLSSQHMHQRVD